MRSEVRKKKGEQSYTVSTQVQSHVVRTELISRNKIRVSGGQPVSKLAKVAPHVECILDASRRSGFLASLIPFSSIPASRDGLCQRSAKKLKSEEPRRVKKGPSLRTKSSAPSLHRRDVLLEIIKTSC